LSTPEEMTPDGALLVAIHAISHTHRGKDSRGKWLADRWNLWYMLTKDGKQVESCKTVYWESQQSFEEAGWYIDWPYGRRIELDPPIEVVIDVIGDKYTVTHVEKRPSDQALLILPTAREQMPE
jgi:hypothetical protein